MKILGIGFGYHDSSSCLIDNNEVKWLVEEDRYTYIKHDNNFPAQSVDSLLSENNLKKDDIDYIVYGENPYKKFTRILKDILTNSPFSFSSFLLFGKEWLGSKLWVLYSLANYFNKPIQNILYLNHHLSHALSAHYTSGYKRSISLVIDAVGEDSSISVYHFEPDFKYGKLLREVGYRDSLCLLYSLVTHFLGFKPNDSECSTMALAAYGKPTLKEKLKKIISFKNGDILINKDIIDFSNFKTNKLTNSLSHFLNISPRLASEKIDILHMTPRLEELVNLAASMQELYEDILIEYISFFQKKSPQDVLTISGGGAQNCKFISRLIKLDLFKDIYIPPTPGDNGLALGAAIYGLLKNNKSPYLKINFDLGAATNFKDLDNVITDIGYEDIKNYSLDDLGYTSIKKTYLEDKDLSKEIAKQISSNKIVALVRGRSESGPRALGHRSIICRADDLNVAKRLSTKVKKRASFRPYAVSTTQDYAQKIFENYKRSSCNKWMQTAYCVNEAYRSEVLSCLHKDNTTRPQVFEEHSDAFLNLTLKALELNLKAPVVLNTSLNESGYPLAKGAKEAYIIFLKSAIDTIVIDNYLIEKVRREDKV